MSRWPRGCAAACPDRGQRELLGAVLRDHHHPPSGIGWARSAGETLSGTAMLLIGSLGVTSPPSPRQAGNRALRGCGHARARGAAHFERRSFADYSGRQVEHPVERLIGEGNPPRGIELGHSDRDLIEHRALRIPEGAKGSRYFLHVLDVDRIARHTFGGERQVGHAQCTPRAVDGGGDHAFEGLASLGGAARHLARGQTPAFFDKLDLPLDHRFGTRSAHRSDVRRVDETQFVIIAAKHIGIVQLRSSNGAAKSSRARAASRRSCAISRSSRKSTPDQRKTAWLHAGSASSPRSAAPDASRDGLSNSELVQRLCFAARSEGRDLSAANPASLGQSMRIASYDEPAMRCGLAPRPAAVPPASDCGASSSC